MKYVDRIRLEEKSILAFGVRSKYKKLIMKKYRLNTVEDIEFLLDGMIKAKEGYIKELKGEE